MWSFLIILSFSLVSQYNATEMTVRSMKDEFLCNYRKLESHCVKTNQKHEKLHVPCDERIYNESNCLLAEINAPQFTEHSLLSSIPSIDIDTSIRKVIITVNAVKNFSSLGAEIYEFLTPRPWWSVTKEPYTWKEGNRYNNQIVLERVKETLEPYFRLISSAQYVDEDTCKNMNLIVHTERMITPGWGSVLRRIGHSGIASLSLVHSMYSSDSNLPDDETAFIGKNECHEKLNKYECVFLRSTNCSLPLKLTGSSGFRSVKGLDGHFFSNATVDGVLIEKQQGLSGSSKPKSKLQVSLEKYNKLYIPGKIPYLLLNSNKSKNLIKVFEPPNLLLSKISVYMDFILRMNYFMRSKVALKLKEYRELHNFPETGRCIGAHVRRGDRMVYGVNMTEWCRDPKNKNKGDKGCGGKMVGSVTMEEIFEQAEKLVDPSIRTLYVASDDQPWVIQEKNRLTKSYPHWQVVYVPAPTPPPEYKNMKKGAEHYEGYQYLRKLGGSDSGAYFLASLKAMQQCEALIGHFSSDSANLYFNRMCMKYGQYQGVCPHRFNVATTMSKSMNP